MSLEHVNVERKLGSGQVVSLAHESELHVVSLATLLRVERELFGVRVRLTPDGTVDFRPLPADSCPKHPTKTR